MMLAYFLFQTSLLVDYIKCMITDNYDPKGAGSKVSGFKVQLFGHGRGKVLLFDPRLFI